MRRAAIAILGTAAATTLLVGIKAQAGPDTDPVALEEPPAQAGSTAPAATGTPKPGGAKPTGTPAPPATNAPPANTAPKKIVGDAVSTPYGTVQVTITVTGDKVTDIAAKLPTGGESTAKSANAGPKLKQQALQKQSADLDTVSGATYTSEGYQTSLQSALDKR
jgi:uncharacterized protein with FMN-binding domain